MIRISATFFFMTLQQQADIQFESDWEFANRIIQMIKATKEKRNQKLVDSQVNSNYFIHTQRDKVNIQVN
jgi:hypothetical protein